MSGGLVIVGASLAGLRAAQAARRTGFSGAVTLIGAEGHLPYDRPPLSKAYLAADGVPDYFVTEEELRDIDVALRLSTVVTALDGNAREVVLGEESLSYDALIVATGASPRRIPSFPEMDGVVTLRTLDDALAIRSRLRPGLQVVVIGAGFIGSEIASSARERGADVTILEAAPVPLVRAVGGVVGAAISTLHGRNGVRLECEVQIAGLEERDGTVVAVRLATGATIPADLVVVGIGAAPTTAWLAGSGIALNPIDGGIVCDKYLETSISGVYAAGDVTHWPNMLLDATMRLENWTNAADQGACAGGNAVVPRDQRVAFETVPYFWSDWYKNRIQFVGTADAESVAFLSGGPQEDKFVAVYRSGERVVGVATLNEPRKVMKFRRLIAGRGSWDDAVELLDTLTANDRARVKK